MKGIKSDVEAADNLLKSYNNLNSEISKVVIGQDDVIKLVLISILYIENGVVYIPELLFRYLLIPTALFVPLFAIFGFFKFKSKWKWILILNFLMLIVFYNFHARSGWPQYGARYYYSGFISLVILATVGFKHFIEMLKNKSQIMHLVIIVLCTHLVFSFIAISQYSYRFKIRLAFSEDIINSCPDNSIVILRKKIDNAVKPNCFRIPSFVDLVDAKRNLFMNTSRLITLNDQHLDLHQIKSNFPNHSICYYDYSVKNKLISYD